MEYLEFEKKIKEYLNEYEINLLGNEEEKIKRLYEYMKYILEKNEFINVTAIKEEEAFVKKHIVDSLYVLKYINLLNGANGKVRYLDIGTGGGFPLVPVKIATGYKSYGLDSILKKLNLINEKEKINIIHQRAEVAAHENKYRETFDIVTTRAVSSLKNVIEYMAGFVKINGIAIILRGKEEEISEEIIKNNGFKVVKKDAYRLFGEERTIIVLRKIKKLNKKLPIKETKYYKENK